MDIFKLRATLGLDSSEYEQGLNEAKNTASSIGGVIAGGLKTIGTIGAAAIGTATTAVGALGMQAVKSYGNYEQLVGGIETLFGTQGMTLEEYANKQGKTIDEVRDDYQMLSATEKAVISYSNEAWKTAGMSNSEYMETVSGFAAALKQSSDTVEDAAQSADMAVSDMADNSAKMGTSLESIKDAYAGFAKQNYTMLDNLKLGYGGTKTEMERLLADAQELSGVEYDISNLSDVYDAIHVIQDDLGITGTTAKEAMFTLEGSANATKAAWQNVVTAIAGGGDLQGAFDGLIESVFGGEDGGGLLNNVIPIIETTMEGIGDFIVSAAPYITEKVPELIAAILPSMVSAGLGLLSTVGQTIVNTVPVLLGEVFSEIDSAISNSSFGSAWDSIKSSITTAIEGIKGSFDTLVTALTPITDAIGGVVEKFQEWVDSGDALNEATELFSTGIELIGEGISLFLESLATVIDYGVQFTEWLTSGSDGADVFIAALTGIATIVGIVTAAMAAHAIAAGAYQVAMMAVQGVTNLVAAAQAALNVVMSMNPFALVALAVAGLVTALIYLYNNNETVRQAIDTAWQAIKNTITTVVTAISTFITTAWNTIKTTISTVLTTISTTVTTIWTTIVTTVTTKMNSIKEKITSVWTTIKTTVSTAITTVQSTISNGFTTMVTKVSTSLTTMKTTITSVFNSIKSTVSGVISSALTWGSDLIDNFVSGIKNGISKVTDAVSSVAESIKSLIGFSEPEKGPLSRFHTFAPDMMQLFAQGIDQNAHLVKDALARNFDLYDDIVKTPDFSDEIKLPTYDISSYTNNAETRDTTSRQDDIIRLLQEIAENNNVTVVLDGDAKRLFKVMQYEARRNEQITGQASFV